MEILWFIIVSLSFISLTMYCSLQILKKTMLKKEVTAFTTPNQKQKPLIYVHPENQRYNINTIRKSNYVVFFDSDQDRNTRFKSTNKKEKKELFPFDLLIVKPITTPKTLQVSNDNKLSFVSIITTICLAIILGTIAGFLLYHVWDFLCSLTSRYIL